MDKIIEAKRVFNTEIEALKKTRDSLGEIFNTIVDNIISCKGKIVVTGVGKPGHIASKMAATFSSLGTPSFFLHPDEAMHGDLGMISAEDVVIAISYSGESEEIIGILSAVKYIGAKLIGITGNAKSTLAKESDIVQILPQFEEACHFGFAPTSSTTVEMCYGDALAVVASEIYGFSEIDFGRIHPGGVLGKKTRFRVGELMKTGLLNACIYEDASVKDAIVELAKKKLGMVNVLKKTGEFVGIISGGDLYRAMEKEVDIYSSDVRAIVTRNPIIIDEDKLAIDALNIMKEKNIIGMPVINNGEIKGTITMQDIMASGIV